MLSFHYGEELFGFNDAIIHRVENDPGNANKHIYFNLARDYMECPQYKEVTIDIHDYCCPHCGKCYYKHNSFVHDTTEGASAGGGICWMNCVRASP